MTAPAAVEGIDAGPDRSLLPGDGRKPRRLALSTLRDYGIVLSLGILFVVLALTSDAFLTTTNLLNILDQSASVGIIACAGTLVIIAGGFDLSVAAVFALSGVVAAAVANELGAPVGLAAGVAAGTTAGAMNGALTTVGRVNPFIATLATMIMFRGAALVLTGGLLILVSDPSFTGPGRETLVGIRYPVWIFVAFAVGSSIVLTRTRFGRYVFACGGNAEAARLSGIRVGLIRGATFAISGFAAGLAGVISASRVSTGQADAGTGMELTAIAAVVIGGTSIMGGEGAIWRTVLGVLLLALIGNGFNLLGVEPTYQQMFQGAIIATAALIDVWVRRRGE